MSYRPTAVVPHTMTCSWCHTANYIAAHPTHCRHCRHRADLARMNCDCPQCSGPVRPNAPAPTAEDLEAAIAWARKSSQERSKQ